MQNQRSDGVRRLVADPARLRGKKWAHAHGNITLVSHRARTASRSLRDCVSIVYWRASPHSGADFEVTFVGRPGSEVNTQTLTAIAEVHP